MIVDNTTVMIDTGRMVAMVHVYGTIIVSATSNSVIILLTAITIVDIIIIIYIIIIKIMIIVAIITMSMIGIAIIFIIIITIIITTIIIIVVVVIIIINLIPFTWLTTLHCNWIRVYSLCLDSPNFFGLATLVFAAYRAPSFA